MISYSSSTLYICNLKSSMHFPPYLLHYDSSPSPFQGCTFRSFGRSLPFRYASQICLKLHTAIKSLFHFLYCPYTPTCTAYFDTPTAHVRRFPHVIDVARDGG